MLQGTGGANHCAPDQFAESVLTTTLRGAQVDERNGGLGAREADVARSHRIAHNEES